MQPGPWKRELYSCKRLLPIEVLLNMNLPRRLGRELTAAGHECRHVGYIGMAKASDVEIVEKAGENRECFEETAIASLVH